MTKVLRIMALGGCICCILRGSEAPGGPTSNRPMGPGGFPSQEPQILGLRGSGFRGLRLGAWMFGCLEELGCLDVRISGCLDLGGLRVSLTRSTSNVSADYYYDTYSCTWSAKGSASRGVRVLNVED